MAHAWMGLRIRLGLQLAAWGCWLTVLATRIAGVPIGEDR